MTKAERIVRYFCNYVIEHKVQINDPEEEDFGQCVSTIKLSKILKDTNIKVESLSVQDLAPLSKFSGNVFRNNDEKSGEYYGEICFVRTIVMDGDVLIEIWDGY